MIQVITLQIIMSQQTQSSMIYMMQYITNKKHRCGIKFYDSSSKYCLNY